jgi:glycosyltransferase involved in cell wall biosynthesis
MVSRSFFPKSLVKRNRRLAGEMKVRIFLANNCFFFYPFDVFKYRCMGIDMKSLEDLKVAIVHDQLACYGGAERVVENFKEIFPQADVYTAFVNKEGMGDQWERFEGWKIYSSWARKLPFIKEYPALYQLLSYMFFSSFDLSSYDIVLSSTVWFSKAVTTKKLPLHLCYCHTPGRSLYGYEHTPLTVKRLIRDIFWMPPLMRFLDKKSAHNVDVMMSNSNEVKKRIKECYDIDAITVYPPIEISEDSILFANERKHVLAVGRLVKTKHFDCAIHACNRLKQPLIIAGSGGRCKKDLMAIAGPTVTFLEDVSDEKLHHLYKTAKAVIYPAENEDFGMVPVESMARGTPVIVPRQGGFLESVKEEVNGYFMESISADEATRVLQKSLEKQWDYKAVFESSLRFSKEVFQEKIKLLVCEGLREKEKTKAELND